MLAGLVKTVMLLVGTVAVLFVAWGGVAVRNAALTDLLSDTCC